MLGHREAVITGPEVKQGLECGDGAIVKCRCTR